MYGMTAKERARTIVRVLDQYLDTRSHYGRETTREFLILALEIALEEAAGSTIAVSRREQFEKEDRTINGE